MKAMEKQLKSISKYLSYILRHNPGAIGLALDDAGWAVLDELIEKANTTVKRLDDELIRLIVETNDKQRFSISECGLMIRTNQGHSIEIELGLLSIVPPKVLLHGTAEKFIASINRDGLRKRNRHHVHLTENASTAKAVGGRYGKPVLLSIDAEAMQRDGFEFYQSANGVWLVDEVPPQYISTDYV